jgi:hypothetical protein
VRAIQKAIGFKPSKYSDDFRAPDASVYGGFQYLDYALTAKIRSSATEVLKRLGRQLINGKFNLISVSFPIKCMAPFSVLE